MPGACPSCGRAFTSDPDQTQPGAAAEAVTDIGGLDDVTGAGIEEITGFASGTAGDVHGAGPTIAAAGGGASGNGGQAHAADPHGPLMPGQNFGERYHILTLLGLGGMGAVYQAWDAELGVVVAVKVIRPEAGADPVTAAALERRFKQELLLARQVTHRNVVRIHDLGEMHGVKYITMPYIQGEDLSTLLKREGRLPVQRTLKIARSMIAGLAAAHAAGVVHRDLKPANIMVTADDEAMIMDFGIARSVTGTPQPAAGPALTAAGVSGVSSGQTVQGSVVGTIEYMAPEQARAQAVDERADLYAFGLILYDLLLGRTRAARTTSAFAELDLRMREAPPPPRARDGSIPEALDRIITRCIQPDPAARYATTAELVSEIERLDDNGEPLPIVRRLTRRMTLTSAVAVLALLGLTFWLARGPAAPVTHEPISVLIADFANSVPGKTFGGALEGAIGPLLEGASFVTSYDRMEARKLAVQQNGRNVIDEPTARLIAAREGIKVILAGSIGPSGAGYRIAVKGANPDGSELWTRSTQSRSTSDADVLTAVADLASEIRTALGDTASRQDRLADSESVTTSSLEALQSYTAAQELYANGKFEEAVREFERSTAKDPAFGRAYAGLANTLFYMGRKTEAEENWKKAVSLMDRMTEREKYRTQGTYFFAVARNYEKAIDNYEALIKEYPTDSSGLNNLAVAYFLVLNFPKAQEMGRRVLQLYPKNVLFRNNLALYAMYAGDFATAARESEPLLKDPGEHPFFKIYLPPAITSTLNGQFDAAASAYAEMAKSGPEGASLASAGLADMAMYRGRYKEAETILLAGIQADARANNTAGVAAKRLMLAELYAATGRTPLALAAAAEALKLGKSESIVVPAARLYLGAGQKDEAEGLAALLDNQLQTQSRAYARIIDGNLSLLNRRRATAIDAFRDAIKHADFWMGRFDMGVAYVQAEAWVEALSELAACEKRRGEATAMFLDDSPTLRYQATLPYWLARAQEGVGQQAAARNNYKAFLAIRGADAPADPLVADARRRAGS
jgi:tetratricopeptide (TPR) repeat protein